MIISAWFGRDSQLRLENVFSFEYIHIDKRLAVYLINGQTVTLTGVYNFIGSR